MRSSTGSRSSDRVGRPQRVQHLARRGPRVDLRQLLAGEEPEPAPPLAARDRGPGHVDGDHGEPALEGARILEAMEGRERPDEDVMVQIGEVAVEAEHAVEDAVDVVGVPVVEGRPRARVAAAEAVDELGVGARRRRAGRRRRDAGAGGERGGTSFRGRGKRGLLGGEVPRGAGDGSRICPAGVSRLRSLCPLRFFFRSLSADGDAPPGVAHPPAERAVPVAAHRGRARAASRPRRAWAATSRSTPTRARRRRRSASARRPRRSARAPSGRRARSRRRRTSSSLPSGCQVQRRSSWKRSSAAALAPAAITSSGTSFSSWRARCGRRAGCQRSGSPRVTESTTSKVLGSPAQQRTPTSSRRASALDAAAVGAAAEELARRRRCRRARSTRPVFGRRRASTGSRSTTTRRRGGRGRRRRSGRRRCSRWG